MRREDMDWPYLRRTVGFFIAAVMLGGVLLITTGFLERRMQREYREADRQLHAVSRRYLAVDEEEALIKQYFPRFIDLHETGLLGAERRLDWIEALQDAARRIQLPDLSYEIAAQRAWQPGFPVTLGGYGLFVSEMSLDMQLLHEGDLFALLELLNARGGGFYTVAECELSRNFAELADHSGAGNVAASCVLEWFSIRLADGSEIAP